MGTNLDQEGISSGSITGWPIQVTNAQALPKSSFSWQTQLLPEPEQGSETWL